MFQTKCSHCGWRGEVDDSLLRQQVLCPECNGEFTCKKLVKKKRIKSPQGHAAAPPAGSGEEEEAELQRDEATAFTEGPAMPLAGELEKVKVRRIGVISLALNLMTYMFILGLVVGVSVAVMTMLGKGVVDKISQLAPGVEDVDGGDDVQGGENANDVDDPGDADDPDDADAVDGTGVAVIGIALGFIIVMPLAYGVFGFVVGIFGAILCNIVFKITRGLTVEIEYKT